MPYFQIRTANSEHQAIAEADDFPTAEDALFHGVSGAIAMVADEAQRGSNASSVEVTVLDENGRSVLRSVVSLSVAPLIVS